MIVKYSYILLLPLMSLQLENISCGKLEDYIDMDYYEEATQEVQYATKPPVWLPGSGIPLQQENPNVKNGEKYESRIKAFMLH